MEDKTNYWEPPQEWEEEEGTGLLGTAATEIVVILVRGAKMAVSSLFGALIALDLSQSATVITGLYAWILFLYLLMAAIERGAEWEKHLRMKDLSEE